ncbi:type I-G CRISPR-associated helicase/endonuclease Cas3g [Schlesneria paludicola]|uniref:type I-G CRISPR-associated helicase/endonuclease Cas3g n=1 Tax=Schlesneria paludicola TaxID=360056 RepID=UPI000299FC56|nr:type I-U CRISPR-associated helicase/endonuclease Cas3 [Schlesneria paludicola]
MNDSEQFDYAFQKLTTQRPFPWQHALYEDWFRMGKFPSACSLPTGIGKTSVVALWLMALAKHPTQVPRRLVYVVNRRTVVDQTTTEVMRLRNNLMAAGLHEPLLALCGLDLPTDEPPLAISTLRGQFADNREWSADPARPAVIIGTVDMIGSRLLFGGYGLGFKSKPLHAGFLGQDVLLVHDEAHLEPAFQACLVSIQKEQDRCKEFRQFHVMELTATPRQSAETFALTEAEKNPPPKQPATPTEPIHFVWRRLCAKKTVRLHEVKDEKAVADQIAILALQYKDSKQAIIVFVRRIDDVAKIVTRLEAAHQKVKQLTGTLRGLERDRLADQPLFKRFLPEAPRSNETVFLVCTSAGEVGVNISADHLVCDLSTFDSMAQRFGRVNRFGSQPDSEIHVVHPTDMSAENELDRRRAKTLKLLSDLHGNASPKAIGELTSQEKEAAFAPAPEILPTSKILFDAWALTTIKSKLPGRPPVIPYLHGIENDDTAETQFAWRNEVTLTAGRVSTRDIEELLDHVPLKPHELLRVATYGKGRAYDQLQKIATRTPDLPLWIIEPDGSLISDKNVSDIVAKRGTGFVVTLAGRTVVLPPQAGGLSSDGTLEGAEAYSAARHYDVFASAIENSRLRFTISTDSEGQSWLIPVSPIPGLSEDVRCQINLQNKRYRELTRLFREHKLPPAHLEFSLSLQGMVEEDSDGLGLQEYLVLQLISSKKETAGTPEWPILQKHLEGVRLYARKICRGLGFTEELTRAIELAAVWHDLGKGRAVWQRGAGNDKTNSPVCKTIHGRPPENLKRYRHEFGSLIDLHGVPEFVEELATLNDQQRDLALHLIGTHHGRGRPHFTNSEANDSESSSDIIEFVLAEVPARFARLQRTFGRWGLAYLESILRAADALDSRRIDATPIGNTEEGIWPEPVTKTLRAPVRPRATPSIQVNLNPANPGQFFACCGLFELAECLWPGVEGWFDASRFCLACQGDLKTLLNTFVECQLTNIMTVTEHARFKELSSMSAKERKNVAGLEDEYKDLGKLLREAPLALQAPFDLRLDWFVDDAAGGSRFKTWAGQQSVLGIATSMKDNLEQNSWRNEDCLKFSSIGCGLPFNFDSDLGSQGGAIDVGFSFDPLAASALTRIESTARPALELLAFIGLQRFRPHQISNDNRFLYVVWNRPLPASIASAAAANALPVPGSDQFEFRLLYRTKYLKSFLPAIPFTGDSDE